MSTCDAHGIVYFDILIMYFIIFEFNFKSRNDINAAHYVTNTNYCCVVILITISYAKLMPLIFSRKHLKCSTNFSAVLITPRAQLFIVNEAMFHHPASAVITSLCVVYHVAVHIMSVYITVTLHTHAKVWRTKVCSRVTELFAPFISPDSPLHLLFIDSPAIALLVTFHHQFFIYFAANI